MDLVTCMLSSRQRADTRETVPDHNFISGSWTIELCWCNFCVWTLWFPALEQTVQYQASSSPVPCVYYLSTLCLPDVMHMTSIFSAILVQWSKSVVFMLSWLQGLPFPTNEFNAIDVVVRYSVSELGFAFEDIILLAWSIGKAEISLNTIFILWFLAHCMC